MLKNKKQKLDIGDRKVVIITNHNTLTETLIGWLSDYNSNINFYNGDQKGLAFVQRLVPEIVIFDPGLRLNREINLFEILNKELINTKSIILTYDETNKYKKFIDRSYIKGIILQWREYQKLPLLINTILRESFNTKTAGKATRK